MKRLAVFASGEGSNFEALAAACESGRLPARIVLLVCDKPEAAVCRRAARRGVMTFAFRPKEYGSKAEYESELVRLLEENGVDWVCLAGYMRLVGPTLLDACGGRIVNLHPSLLPAFKGAHAIEQAVDAGVKIFGATIHRVDASLDGGEILAQRAFDCDLDPALPREARIACVTERMHALEHELYVDTMEKLLTTK